MRSSTRSGIEPAGGRLAGDLAHRVDQLGPAAVVEREREREPAVARGQRLGLLDAAQHPARHPPGAPADEPHPHALAVQLVAARDEQPLVEVHQEAHLVERPAPVLGRERVHRQPLEPDLERALDRVEQRLFARRVAVGALQAPALRPAAVAVHDDRDVLGSGSRAEIEIAPRRGNVARTCASRSPRLHRSFTSLAAA